MEQLDQLAAALAKAQASFPAVPKSGKNPFLKNDYATLDDIIGAIRGPLGENGLSFVQLLEHNGEGITLRTILLHESGQTLAGVVGVTPGQAKGVNDLQALGAAITYMKRYTLGAMLGIATDGDTDGEGAPKDAGRQPQRQRQPEPTNRPLSAPTVRNAVRKKAGWQNGEVRTEGEPITEQQVKSVGSLMAKAVKVEGMNQALMDKARHDILDYLLGVNETKRLTKREASAIIDWLKEADGWNLNEYGRAEAQAILTALAVEAGQQEMEL